MNDKHIVIVCGTLASGGAERVISTLSTPLADSFKEVTLVTWREAPQFYSIDSRVKLISLPKLAGSDNDLTKGRAFRKLIKNSKTDLVLSFLTIFNLFVLLSLNGIHIPIICAERNDPRYIKGGFVMKSIRNFLYLKSSGLLCQTEYIKNYFNQTLQKKCHVIYNPVIMHADMIGAALKKQKTNRIVSVGRLHGQKNHKLLIDSFKIFHATHPDYSLTIYGTGELKDDTQRYIESQHLNNSVILAGEQKNVKELIQDAKVFVMTSFYEGMPNALIEAMCLGLPCISTKVSGATDLIKNAENGYLVDYNPYDIADKISLIVDNNELSEGLGSNAIELYKKLDVNTIAKLWIDYISMMSNVNKHKYKGLSA